MSKGLNLHTGDGMIAKDATGGILIAYGNNIPALNTPGYAPGCRFIRVSGNSIGTLDFINIGTRAACNFVSGGLNGAISVSFVYGEGTVIDAPIFVADRAYTLLSIIARPTIAGTDAGAVTAILRRAASGVGIGSGTSLHSGTINLKGTIEVNQIMPITVSAIPIGVSIGIDVSGVPTAARGIVSLLLLPA